MRYVGNNIHICNSNQLKSTHRVANEFELINIYKDWETDKLSCGQFNKYTKETNPSMVICREARLMKNR